MIGLSIAEALARRGADVVVLEASRWGEGASAGNAGWISPGLANPVPGPGVMMQALKWMPNPRSPFLVRPTLRVGFVRWTFDFWRSTRPSRYGAGMAALAALGSRVLDDFDRLVGEGVQMEMHAAGLLFVGRTAAGVRSEAQVLREAQALGYLGSIREMSRAETLAHEPALSDRLAGGVLAFDERHVRPETLTRGLVRHLRAGGHADLRDGIAVRALIRAGDRWHVDHDGAGGPLVAPRVVVATGWQAGELLAPLGIRLPLEGGKGYSVTVPDPLVRPRGAMYLLEDRVAITPFDGALRLAGTMELGASDVGLNRRRIAAIKDAGRRSLVGWSDAGAVRWAGFRPMLPDGLPAIGPVPGLPGLHIATGHAMLGVTLGPTTGEVLAPSVLSGRTSPALAPFSLARFGNRGHRGA